MIEGLCSGVQAGKPMTANNEDGPSPRAEGPFSVPACQPALGQKTSPPPSHSRSLNTGRLPQKHKTSRCRQKRIATPRISYGQGSTFALLTSMNPLTLALDRARSAAQS